MASLRCAMKWNCLVSRRCTDSLYRSFTKRGVRTINLCTARNHRQITSFSKRKGLVTESWKNRTFSTRPENILEHGVESTSSIKSENNAQKTGESIESSARKAVHSEDDEETVEIPDDVTEVEFVEICDEKTREKYAKMRLSKLSSEEEKRLKIIKLMYDVALSVGGNVPEEESMTDGRWLFLLLCRTSEHAIKRQFQFWRQLDYTIKAKAAKKGKKIVIKDIDYGENLHNKLLRRIANPAMNRHYFSNLAFSMRFGQPIIFDFGFADQMKVKEMINTINQFKICHGINKLEREPFHLHVCGFPKDGKFRHILDRTMTDINRSDLPITITSKDIVELDDIPKERLVYLSPNSPYVLTKLNPNDVYVIGGIVDTGPELPHTYAKAKKLNVRTAKLPLDRYFVFQGNKSLTLNQIMSVMVDLKNRLPMREAVRHVPARKIQKELEPEQKFVFV